MKMNLKLLAPALACLAVVCTASAAEIRAATSRQEAQAAVDARRLLFKEISRANRPVRAVLKRERELDPEVIVQSATVLSQLARKIPAVYAVDTRAFRGIETLSSDDIWTSFADFERKAAALDTAAAQVLRVARGGDGVAIRRAMLQMTNTCGACHDRYIPD